MKRSALALSCILLAAAAVAASAQVVPSAEDSRFSITVGAMGSIFQPDFDGQWKFSCTSACTTNPVGLYYPVAEAASQPLIGPGAYVDMRFSRWVQLEAEGRWLRFNRFQDIHQDNYLVGPRVPVYHFWKATVSGKALIGFSRMDLGYGYHGNFTALAFGGGVDVRLTKRISIRAFDGEYQYWPSWGNSSISPYGASAGIGYKIF